ncbi:hypothetical protein J2T60_002292 [Natronospira proteinivora]|uniref:Outer membrane protein beta-barrel domain-containing protein n=1 Tax=Natronospira proteinivora TaxID=1807133 RepID=A0ABT1GB66_9GAMM|nr:outer membrane beta-barrel protein [Natronospira proteinivora]MCP1728292.1 hypothetical protein [Natronospira proteinivora]
MKRQYFGSAFVLGVCLAASNAMAQDLENFYIGGGLSHNSASGLDGAFGAQVLGGYDFGPILGDASIMAEVGYMNTGNMDRSWSPGSVSARGLWANGVVSLPLTGHWSLLGRAGLDFGDDDGIMVGIGGAYRITQQLDLRGELVTRDNIDSFQFNFAYRF